MELHVTQHDTITVVAVEGDLDALTAETLTATLDDLIERGNVHLLVDMNQVRFCATAGIRSVLRAMKAVMAQDGKLALAGLQDGVRRTFEMTGVFQLVAHYPDVESALAGWD